MISIGPSSRWPRFRNGSDIARAKPIAWSGRSSGTVFSQKTGGLRGTLFGLNLLRLGFLARRQFDISTIALPFMKELSNLTKETVLLTAVNGTKGVVL